MTEIKDVIDASVPYDVTKVVDRTGETWTRVDQDAWRLDEGSVGETATMLTFAPLTVTAVREPEPEACPAHGFHPHPNGVEPVNLCLDCPQCRPIAQTIAAIHEPGEVVHYRIPGDASPETLCGLDVWADDTSVTERAGSSNCTGCRAAADEGKMREPACPHGYEAEKWCDKCTPPVPSVLLDLVRQYGELRQGGYLAPDLFERIAALVPQPADTVKATQRALLDEIASLLDVGAYDDLAAEVKRLLAPADPSVLSLPQVPPGTVALITRNRDGDEVRFIPAPGHPDSWVMASGSPTGDWLLVEILRAFDGSVTVVMREPRTWPKIDNAPDDLKKVEGASGRRYAFRTRDGAWESIGDGGEHECDSLASLQNYDGPLTEVLP